MYTFPNTSLDNARRLLGLTGSLWSESYAGRDLIESILYARARLEAQNHTDVQHLVASISRFTLPVLRTAEWYGLTLKLSDRIPTPPRYDDGVTAYDDGITAYDAAFGAGPAAWPIPKELKEVPAIFDAITAATVTLTSGVDFAIDGSILYLQSNPFTSRFPVREIYDASGNIVDYELTLWLYRSRWDKDAVYLQFGYAVDVRTPSTRTGKNLVNAVYDALVEGTSSRSVEEVFSAICDIPLAVRDDVVVRVATDARYRYVITDLNVYRFARNSQVLVKAGDTIVAGQSLTDGLRLFRFNSGQTPSEIRAIAVGHGFLSPGYFQDLVFENKTVATVVEENVDGYTKISFELGGMPLDVAKFWDEVHAKGVAAGQTLAMLLDRRPAEHRGDQPSALALPATINPLQFLVGNVFRNNVFAVLVKPGLFGPEALGLGYEAVLRKIIPPGIACVVLVALEIDGDRVTMDGPGTSERPGYRESVQSYLGQSVSDRVGPSNVHERVRARYINVRCQ